MRIRVLLLFLLPALLLALTVWIVLRFARRCKRFRLADSAAAGTVTEVRTQTIQKGVYSFKVFVRYEIGGNPYQTKYKLPTQLSPEPPVKAGDAVTVHYQAGYPAEGIVRNDTAIPLIPLVCTFILLFVSVLVTGSFAQFDTGWFTQPERRAIGVIRLVFMALGFLGIFAVLVWMTPSRRRGIPLEGTVREIKQAGKQTVIYADCEIKGVQHTVLLAKETGDTREYAAGDSIALRMKEGGAVFWVDRAYRKSEIIKYGIVGLCIVAAAVLVLADELIKLKKL